MRFFLATIILFTSIFLTAQVRPNTQARVFDGKMILQRCSVSVKTDGITAITFIELEFYNSRDIEIEGLYKFQLRSGQVVSDFQLDLNGKYREGSIEEKWKASNAYNTIVGKRVDPALLTKDFDNNYSLRIYPVPAKSRRKVTMTLHEILPPETNAKHYLLPLNSNDTTGLFSFRFEASNQSIKPSFRSEWLQGREFIAKQNGYIASADVRSVVLNKAIDVLLPSLEKQLLLVKANADKYHFALQLKKNLTQYYSISPKSVTVFWDASASAASRDIHKEINFLKQYLLFHQTQKVTVIPFRHKPFDTVVFSVNNRTVQQLEKYLSGLAHEGATGFGSLNFATVKSDVVLLFSDGYNSIGKRKPKEGNVLVYAIHAIHHAIPVDTLQLKTITGEGGAVINLYKQTMNVAIEKASIAERMLLRIESGNGKTIIESTLPAKIDQPFLVYGTMHLPTDTLKLYYGNSQLINSVETVPLTSNIQLQSSGIDRLPMLMHYRQMIQNKDWNDVLDFGLSERVVTQQTAFIVLERVEDYIRYNITPSKDLEEECRRLNYVKNDTRSIRRSLAAKTTGADLTNLVRQYNWRIKKWDATASELIYNPEQIPITSASQQNEQQPLPGNSLPSVQQALQGRVAGLSSSNYNELNEVVVVGYGTASKKNITGSVSIMQQQNVFLGHNSVASVLAGRVPGLQVIGNTATPGAVPEIRIRGAASFNGSNQPLYVVDGVPVNAETVQQVVNVNDIESITVLKDASATALYGSRGSNGVIVIQMKRGKFYNRYYYQQHKYKLSEQEDVEYMQEIKGTELNQKPAKYNELKEEHGYSAAFNMDMAEHLFSCGLNNEAFAALMNALDIVHVDFFMQRTAGFILERWKQFAAAEEIFTDLLAEHSAELYLYSDLAWVYYQQGKYQQAVDLLNKGIHINFGTDESNKAGLKAMLLNDMNAMIEMHRSQLDLSAINPTLIKALPADLVIMVEDNTRNRIGLEVYEPGIHSMVVNGHPSKKGGFISTEENNSYGYYNYYTGIETYTKRTATTGRYKIAVNYNGGSSYPTRVPSFIRLKVFRNFGKPNQSIQIETVAMDNQYGNIEIREIKY